jgi:hypothetical protein
LNFGNLKSGTGFGKGNPAHGVPSDAKPEIPLYDRLWEGRRHVANAARFLAAKIHG